MGYYGIVNTIFIYKEEEKAALAGDVIQTFMSLQGDREAGEEEDQDVQSTQPVHFVECGHNEQERKQIFDIFSG